MIEWMKYCPTDGNPLVPPPAAWNENLLEWQLRQKFARCPVCGKTARELFRLDEGPFPSTTQAPARLVPAPPSPFQKSLRRYAQVELAAELRDRSKYLVRNAPAEQARLKEQYLRQRFAP